ncbi:MAG: 30S ribosome-binding factor RbfA [Gammaproteobacteria bacterium]|nr:30S ribosome-binding factor RbfA [Gammaproteobacteria bacterium]
MPQEFSRTDRIADQIQRELAGIIQKNVKDPRVGMVTITAVQVSKELEYARIYFTVLGGEDAKKSTMTGLTKAAGFLRREIAKRLKLRNTPELQFQYDASIEHALHMSNLIDAAVASDKTGA